MIDEIMIRRFVEDDGKVWLIAPKITHNPWAMGYELTPEASRRITGELAQAWLDAEREKDPNASIAVSVGGELICGYYPV